MFHVLISLPVQHLHKSTLPVQMRPFYVLIVCIHFIIQLLSVPEATVLYEHSKQYEQWATPC